MKRIEKQFSVSFEIELKTNWVSINVSPVIIFDLVGNEKQITSGI